MSLRYQAAIAFCIIVLAAILSWFFKHYAVLLIVAFVIFCWAIISGIKFFQREILGLKVLIQERQMLEYRQVESLMGLYNIIKNRTAFPPMRDWAVSPDFALPLAEMILEKQPRVIVELGSGVSTLIAAYCMKMNGRGKIFSFEHQEQYCEIVRNQIAQHKMANIAKVVHAPLVRHRIGNEEYMWYDKNEMENKGKIDLLIVDGPPASIQKMSRYPAVQLLLKFMAKDAVIVMDDGVRDRMIAERWVAEIPNLKYEFKATEKGLIILHTSL